MTNKELLYKKINERGMKIGFLCQKCGMSHTTFNRKANGDYDFTVGEINLIMKVLSLTKAERDAIFFADKCECQ